ncbi:hypothetical protein ACNKHQ_00375 [Shigella flexneri]
MLLFPPGEIHHYGRHPDASEWLSPMGLLPPARLWHEWLNWPPIVAQTGFYRRTKGTVGEMSRAVLARLSTPGRA